jgi:hypothetical protein
VKKCQPSAPPRHELDFSNVPKEEQQACLFWELKREACKKADPELHWLLTAPLPPEAVKLPFSKLIDDQRADLRASLKVDRDFDQLCVLGFNQWHLVDVGAVPASKSAPNHWPEFAINPNATLKQILEDISRIRAGTGKPAPGKRSSPKYLLRDLTIFRLRGLEAYDIIKRYHGIYGEADRSNLEPARVSAIKKGVRAAIDCLIAEAIAVASNP